MGNEPSVAIIGSGFSGLGLAIRLKQAGITHLTIFEKSDRVGGVWRDNAYPGAACDAPSHLYSYSFEPNPDWSRRFAPQPEILAYLQHCADKYQIGDHIRFGTEVTDADFDSATGRWTIRTADGPAHTADILVAACGQLSNPAYPDIPGLDSFAGSVFHSARWNHDHDQTGRRIAVIGNGASAVQLVPQIAARAEHLHLFQRTPHWVATKADRVYPRWRRRLNHRVPLVQKAARLAIFAFFEALLNPMLVARRGRGPLSAHVRIMCWINLRKVRDPALRNALTPSYEPGCKRILQSGDYYPALTRDNVTLVTDPITKVTATAVVTADGTEHPADTIIIATGFRSNDFMVPLRVTGLHGTELGRTWRDTAPRAYLGLTAAGFPNFFLMYGPNTNVGSGSIIYMLESQITYIIDGIRTLHRTGATYLELREDIQQTFDHHTQQRLATTVWNTGGCTSWTTTPQDATATTGPAPCAATATTPGISIPTTTGSPPPHLTARRNLEQGSCRWPRRPSIPSITSTGRE